MELTAFVLHVQGGQLFQSKVLSALLFSAVSSLQPACAQVRLCSLHPARALQNMHAAREVT